MNLLRIFRPFALPFLLAISVNQALEGQAPPCRPCGGIVVSNPLAAARALEAKPLLEGEARLYVAWDVELEEAARAAEASTAVAKAGGTPWIRMIFRTASPLLANADTLSQELAAAAKLAGAAAEKTHFQILWEPATAHSQKSDLNPEEYAYLFKRVSVAVTGARTQARVITAALPPAVGFLNTFYGEGTAAYVDGLALRPATEEVLAAGIARAAELDPGRPVVLDAAPWPEDPWLLLADAARWTEAGASLVFFSAESASHIDGQTLLPLKLLAREFQGDLSLDPYSKPTGAAEAWSFVRGEDLSLRIIVRAAADAENLDLLFPDRQLKKPTRIDPTTGIAEDLFGQTRTADGLRIRLPVRDKVTLLTLDRMSAEEIEGLEEELTVTDQRQMPVEEILRRLQAFDDSQARRLQHYRALNTTHMRFQFGTGAQGLEATFEGDFFFKQGQGFDWAWQRFYINGVRWRGKNLPEIPLIQAEKAAALPLEIHFTKEYSYRLRGTETVDGRDCWVVDFSPDVKPEPGRTLYRGSVWIDQEFFGRVRTRALQLGLEGDVISNEETIFYSPLTLQGEPGDWTPVDLWLPLRVVGQQLLSILNATTLVETEAILSALDINGTGFAEQRQAVLDSDATMVRDTEEGLRYLVKDKDTGLRVVKDELKKSSLSALAGVFWDESQDFPIPLGGVNYFSFDFKGTGKQVNIFFAGALLIGNIADPDVFGSKWDAGANVFALALGGSDSLFRDGEEIEEEEVDTLPANVSFFLGRPLGSFGKLDLSYSLRLANFSRADDTADEFVLPEDHLVNVFQIETKYNRGGYRFSARGRHNVRSKWRPWGLPGSPELEDFDEETKEYDLWGATLAKTWWLPRFKKFSIELEYQDGQNLDRFSKYGFGIFNDIRVHGYQSDNIRASRAWGGHLSYGFEVGELLRLQLIGDGILATDEESGLDDELLGGIGLEGTFIGPWQTIINVDLGVAVVGPENGFSAMVTFLKLIR